MSHITKLRRRQPHAALHLRQGQGNGGGGGNSPTDTTTVQASVDPNLPNPIFPTNFPTPIPVEPSSTTTDQPCIHLSLSSVIVG
jgi:hypothetical protein